MNLSDWLAIVTIILWPAIPLFWIPVHCLTKVFRKFGLLTYILPLVTWLPLACLIYLNRLFLLQFKVALPLAVNVVGIILFVSGTLLQIWTGKLLRFLGLIGLPEISNRMQGRLVINGAFSVVRHPTYLSHTMMFLGVFFMTGTTAVGVVTLLDFIVINIFVIPLEEKELEKRFGKEYLEYREKTPRYFPKIRQRK